MNRNRQPHHSLHSAAVTTPPAALRCCMALLIAALLLPETTGAETVLSGELTVSRIDSTGNPYIVESDLIVPSGTTCTIEAGAVFLFNPFTGITAEGTLKIHGTFEKPVIFSSVNNMQYNPASIQDAQPFDWNGVTVAAESRETVFKSLHLCHSVYGIKSQTPYVSIVQSLFYQNGQYHFTIKDKIQNVQDNIPYSFNDPTTPAEDKTVTVTEVKPADTAPSLGTIEKKRRAGGTTAVRVVSIAVAALGAAGGAVVYRKVEAADRAIAEMKPQSINPATGAFYTRSEVEEKRDERKLLSTGSVGGFVLGGIGLACFSLTFLF